MQYTEPNRLEDSQEPTDTIDQSFNPSDFFKNHLVRTEDGSLEIKAEGLGPVELALLETEKRRRGSQAATSREKLRADKAQLELEKVKETIPTVDVSATQIDPTLKYSDPDEYIRQTLEAQRNNPYQEVFDTASQYAQQTVGAQSVQEVIAEHNQANPTRQLTEEMLNLDLPPRLLGELEAGKVTPQDFLAQAADILYRPTETHNENIPETPNLGAVGGSTTPSSEGVQETALAQYASAIF